MDMQELRALYPLLFGPDGRPIEPTWGVSITMNGQDVVTIESNHLSGVEITKAHEDVIRTCAHHLLAFIGDAAPPAHG